LRSALGASSVRWSVGIRAWWRSPLLGWASPKVVCRMRSLDGACALCALCACDANVPLLLLRRGECTLLARTRLTCCRCATAWLLSPRCCLLTAYASPPALASVLAHAACECTCFEADLCRDGRVLGDLVIRCSSGRDGHTSRLQGVISREESESDVGSGPAMRLRGARDAFQCLVRAMPAAWL